jgi:aspartate/methionine/tyrosine aminotransferase
MAFQRFEMERWQSTWENRVRYNLSESGVHPLSTAELLALSGGAGDALLKRPLGYPQSNGTEPLRAAIAALYPGAGMEQVLVTTGSAEANFVNCWTLITPGTKVAVVMPTYMQTWGLARNFGAEIRPVLLRESLGWQPDPSDIDAAIGSGTALVIVTNPNNPTGAVLADELVDRIVARAESCGAWILADEVYQGAERTGPLTPSLWGRSPRVIVTNGLSKAYGLPGLRIGWCVAPTAHVGELWARKDYTTIGPTVMSDALATLALGDSVRPRILERTRSIIRTNWAILEHWMAALRGELAWRAPDAGAICYARYRSGESSSAVAERLRARHDVLIVPGDHFTMDGYLRFGFGPPAAELREALERVALGLRPPGLAA